MPVDGETRKKKLIRKTGISNATYVYACVLKSCSTHSFRVECGKLSFTLTINIKYVRWNWSCTENERTEQKKYERIAQLNLKMIPIFRAI